MRKRLIHDLLCPNTGLSGFSVVAHEYVRDGQSMMMAEDSELQDDDDVQSGFIVNVEAGTVYPIVQFVLSMLKDVDADIKLYMELLTRSMSECSKTYREIIQKNLDRLAKCEAEAGGLWNREEMAYYDREVATEELRAEFRERICTEPLWHIFIEREKHLLRYAELKNRKKVLEIGCGNARTVARTMRPADNGFQYVGTDISLKRLLLAKSVLPESDFVQASAFTLPFKPQVFGTAIAFGVLHHLPNPTQGLQETMEKVQSGGVFLIHEPIAKTKLIPAGKLSALKRVFHEYDHSEHDNEIDLDEFVAYGQRHGHTIVHSHLSGSLLRTVLATGPLAKVPFCKGRWWWNRIIAADRVFLSVFCRKRGRLGPNAVFLVLGKS